MDAIDEKLLDRLQRAFPVTKRPWLSLARGLGISEKEAMQRAQALKDAGLVRSISGVFDPIRLGMKAALVAARVEEAHLTEVADAAGRFPEVTHNYAREDIFNLWFTVMAASEARLQEIVRAVGRCPGVEQLIVLPALRKFKLRVQFDFVGAIE